MSVDKQPLDQQIERDVSRARNPNASRQTIADEQADPEFRINRERLKTERLAREAEASKANGK
jgi:hypothetical protein